jgi:replicative DNA helicase
MNNDFDNLPEKEIIPEAKEKKEAAPSILDYSLSKYQEDYYESLGGGDQGLIGIDTGFSNLNKKLHGLRGLVILAGAPKAGKTSYILQMTWQAAQNKTPIIFYSLEMSRQQITTRILSRLSGISYIEIMRGAKYYLLYARQSESPSTEPPKGPKFPFALKTTEDIERLKRADYERCKTDNFYLRTLEDSTPINFSTMKEEIDALERHHKTKNILVVIDHLQIFPIDPKDYRDQLDKENNLIKQFNEIQKQTGATIVLISQVNKQSMQRGGDRLAAVKGSIDTVYLANSILSLFENESQKENKNESVKYLTLEVTSRDTAGGNINLEFYGERQEFVENQSKV